MFLEVITPENKVFEGEIVSVQLPGTDGSFQLLDSHCPVVSTLKKGNLIIVDNSNETKEIEINGGVVELSANHAIVLAE